ncbi:MAG: FtsW/RodA/SpoVE family cell cycle protein [bacterium]
MSLFRQTDFIFAVIFEEVGLVGATILLLFYFFIFYYGIKIALKQEDNFYKFLAIGIVISMFIQFFINIAVVTGIIPVTGVTLPFLSYGGSSLILNYMMVGILVSIDKAYEEKRITS